MTALETIGEIDPIALRCLQQLLEDRVVATAHYADEIDSTNSWALRQLGHQHELPSTLPALYIANNQTAGRGRLGRAWQSSEQALTFSLALDAHSIAAFPVPLAVGLLLAEAIDSFIVPKNTELKWPNDVLIESQKVAGVLVERNASRANAFVIGIGINTHWCPPPDALDRGNCATSLHLHTSREFHRFDLLDELLRQLLDEPPTAPHMFNRYRLKCHLTGRMVTADQANQKLRGRCRGIDETGGLRIETPSGLQVITSGEVTSVRTD